MQIVMQKVGNLLGLVLVACAFTLSAVEVGYADSRRDIMAKITIVGDGTVRATPDMATIDVGVISVGRRAQETLRENSQATAALVAATKKAGVADADIGTKDISIYPQYPDSRSSHGKAPVIVGYRVSNQLQIVIRDMSVLGPLLDQIVVSGANRVGNISFGFSNTAELMDQARASAIRNARDRAALYAENGGFEIGRILRVREVTNHMQPRPYAARMMAAEAAPVPIEAGSREMSIQVEIMWEIRGDGQ